MPQETTKSDSGHLSSEAIRGLFNEALALQQQQNWDGALTAYSRLLDLSPNTLSGEQLSAVYHNMSVVAAQQSEHLKAYVWNKLALHHQRTNSEAQNAAPTYAQNFSPPQMLNRLTGTGLLQKSAAQVPFDLWMMAVLLFTALFCRKWAKLAAMHRKSASYKSFWSIPRWPLYSLFIAWLLTLSAAYLCFAENRQLRAYVLTPSAPVQTAPGENKSIIYDAPGGLELEVIGQQGDFIQVRRSGVFSGWIQRDQLALTAPELSQN